MPMFRCFFSVSIVLQRSRVWFSGNRFFTKELAGRPLSRERFRKRPDRLPRSSRAPGDWPDSSRFGTRVASAAHPSHLPPRKNSAGDNGSAASIGPVGKHIPRQPGERFRKAGPKEDAACEDRRLVSRRMLRTLPIRRHFQTEGRRSVAAPSLGKAVYSKRAVEAGPGPSHQPDR